MDMPTRASSHCALPWPSLGVSTERETERGIFGVSVSPYEDTSPVGQGPTLMTSFKFFHPLIGHISKHRHIKG